MSPSWTRSSAVRRRLIARSGLLEEIVVGKLFLTAHRIAPMAEGCLAAFGAIGDKRAGGYVGPHDYVRYWHLADISGAMVEVRGRRAETTIDILPVVHHPDIPCWVDGEIGLHLQSTAHVTTGRRNLVTGLEAGRTALGADTTQFHD